MFSRPCLLSGKLLHWNQRIYLPYRCRYDWVLSKIVKDKDFQEHCRDAGINKAMIASSLLSFRKEIVNDNSGTNLNSLKAQYVLEGILKSEYGPSSIFPLFLSHAKSKFLILKNLHQLRDISDLTTPVDWYPDARMMERSIIFHAGPTNSGKTHAALERFLSANTGIYCCPLRLLAREITAKSRARQVRCSLITGEERDLSNRSTHTACTVEMADLSKTFDVAVIDEIQIIAHEERGWAWTAALLGLRAKEIHVCGEPRAISIVKRLCEECGDDFAIQEYERLTTLRVKKYPVGSIGKLRAGDCIVCFKRKDIYSTVSQLKASGKDSAIIYGKLPPSTKRKEATKFNEFNNGCDILVATDAVGMGLNLNIKRIVFNSMSKGVKNDNGDIVSTQLTTPEVLQIAGRAGRFGFQESGEVTTLHEHDIGTLHELLLNPKEEITHARINPTIKQYVNFSQNYPKSNLHSILTQFNNICQIDGNLYELCSQRDQLDLAQQIFHLRLSFKDAFKFSLCPINADCDIPLKMFLAFVKQYSMSKPVTYNCVVLLLRKHGIKIPFLPTSDSKGVTQLEDVHNSLGAYLWLSYKFPKYFPDRDHIKNLRTNAENVITLSLRNVRNNYSEPQKKAIKALKRKRQKMRPVVYYR